MYGLLIAFILFLINYLFRSYSGGSAFLASANFLNTWFLFWCLLSCGYMAIRRFVIVLSNGAETTILGECFAKLDDRVLFGFGEVGTKELIRLVVFTFFYRYILIIGGTDLLIHSGVAGMPFSEFDNVKLFYGSLMILLGFAFVLSKHD